MRSVTRPGEPPTVRALGLAALAVGAGASLASLVLMRRGASEPAPVEAPPVGGLYAAAALLALSVLADSALEHDRGEFRNPGMFTPLVTAGVTAVAAAGEMGGERRGADVAYAAAVGIGAGGLAFHLFNLLKRPGRLNWHNLFYAAPIGAPAALSLAGLLGLAARRTRQGWRGAGRALAGLSALGLAGTVGEAGLLHFRGAFQNPFMWLPVSLPPVGAALLARAAADPESRPRPLTRGWLGLTAALGIGGVGFHIFGVSRAMGGWKNWRQNMIDGPPIPAPPAFTALSIAGLAALALQRREALEAAA
jgi:hypothetical protein